MVDGTTSRVEVFDEAQNVTRYHCSNGDDHFLFEVNYERGAWWLRTQTDDYTGWIENCAYITDKESYRCAVHKAVMKVDKKTKFKFNFVLYFDSPTYVLDAHA